MPAATESAAGVATQRWRTDPEVAAAIGLGWRVAALHGLTPSDDESTQALLSDPLPTRKSLPARDRLELELRAAAGDAEQAGVSISREVLEELLELAHDAADSPAEKPEFRAALARVHVDLDKGLWTQNETRGKAYELGNFLSDTWNRVLRPRRTRDSESELVDLFRPQRVEQIKELLDDLQTRIDPAAVHAVQNHLDAWRDAVNERLGGEGRPAAPSLTSTEIWKKYAPVERQTVIWRQMLTGDKDPEAYIDRDKRAEVRDELTRFVWRHYRRYWWALFPIAILGALVGWLLSKDSTVAGTAVGLIGAVAGALGITRASVGLAIRNTLQGWTQLLWNRSLATVICRETSQLDELFPESVEGPRPGFQSGTRVVRRRTAAPGGARASGAGQEDPGSRAAAREAGEGDLRAP